MKNSFDPFELNFAKFFDILHTGGHIRSRADVQEKFAFAYQLVCKT